MIWLGGGAAWPPAAAVVSQAPVAERLPHFRPPGALCPRTDPRVMPERRRKTFDPRQSGRLAQVCLTMTLAA
jgi:hypothetical protein